MALYKALNPGTDVIVGRTKIKTTISGNMPASISPKSLGGGRHESGIEYPPGYARGDGECSSSFFTLTTASQILDIGWGFRTGCLSDTGSMFYQTQKTWRNGNSGGFTSKGRDGLRTASMLYKSTSEYLNDGADFSLDDVPIDLLGVLNFKRAKYREELSPGSFILTANTSGSYLKANDPQPGEHVTFKDDTAVQPSIVGDYTFIRAADNTIVGAVYQDYSIAILDLFKFFFTSSADRKNFRRAELLKHLTGSASNTALPLSDHGIAFFSGNLQNTPNKKRTKYFGGNVIVTQQSINNLLNFYSGSYSQSLASVAMEIGGVEAQSLVNFQSSIHYCRAGISEFNYSANPTFVTGSGENATYRTDVPITYITSIGLYNDRNEMMAVGKLSQPLRKDFETEASMKVRLDF